MRSTLFEGDLEAAEPFVAGATLEEDTLEFVPHDGDGLQDLLLEIEAALAAADEPTRSWRVDLATLLGELANALAGESEFYAALRDGDYGQLEARAVNMLCVLNRRHRYLMAEAEQILEVISQARLTDSIEKAVARTHRLVASACRTMDLTSELNAELDREALAAGQRATPHRTEALRDVGADVDRALN